MRQQTRHLPWRWLTRWRAGLAALALLLAFGGAALAQGGGLDLGWWTVDGGGTMASSSGDLTLSGTIGQPDAAPASSSGGLTLQGGFWFGEAAVASSQRVFLPVVTRASAQPDLVATIALNPAKTAFTAGEAVEVLVTVTNQGNAAAGPFWVDLYINPSQPPTASNQPWTERCGMQPCFGMAWPVDQALAPGQRVTLSSRNLPAGYSIWPGWFAAGTTDLYAYADSWNPAVAGGAVVESNEANNRATLHGLLVTGQNPATTGLRSLDGLQQRPALGQR